MTGIKASIGRLSDRMLGLVAPRATADAACTYTWCCYRSGGDVTPKLGRRKYDVVRGTYCTACQYYSPQQC